MTASDASVAARPRRVLVTGAAGRAGRAVLDLLASYDVAVTGLDRVDPGELKADRVVVGDATDPKVARTAVRDVEAVIHLAAIPTPIAGKAKEVFVGNAAATFVVLDEAAQAGVRRAAFASSLSITGLPWAEVPLHPPYLPIDEDMPLLVADPYALSKQADEATGAMMVRRYGMTAIALRYPFLAEFEHIEAGAAQLAGDPGRGARTVWTYLDVRDAARAAWLAVTRPLEGFHAIYVAAPRTLVAQPTEELLAKYHPDVERRGGVRFAGRDVPMDLTRARELLGFEAEHVVD